MQNVPKIVQQRLQMRVHTAADLHPDADLLTAFVEESLAEAERARVMSHLAGCGDCREVVTLALPASEAAESGIAGAKISRSRPAWPVLRWGVVAAGLALVTSVGVLQFRQRHRQREIALSKFVPAESAGVKASQGAADSRQKNSPETNPVQLQTAERIQVERKATPRPARVPAAGQTAQSLNGLFPAPQARRRTDSGNQIHGQAAGIGSGSGAGVGAANAPMNYHAKPQRDAFAPSSSAATPAAGAQQTAPPAHQAMPAASSQVVEVESANSLSDVASEPASGQRLENQDQRLENKKDLPVQSRASSNLDVVGKAKDPVPPQAAAALVLAPTKPVSPSLKLSASARWSISASGALQRSFDSGQTWENVNVNSTLSEGLMSESVVELKKSKKADKAQSDSKPIFRAVAAAGAEVWAGGSGAMLYHSVDSGQHWLRVRPSAAGFVLKGDLTRIEFSDPQHVTITTSAAEVWTTADDGQTWQK